MIIDTHAHINMNQFDHDIDEVIQRARDLGVEKIIVIGMDKFHNKKAIELAEKYDHVYAAVGVHPVDINKLNVNDVEPLLTHPKVVAVGETGIDLYWKKDNIEAQKRYFIEQIKLAIKYDLPIIIHTRDSFYETYECIEPYKGKIRGVFHFLSATIKEAMMVIDLGLLVGVGGVVTFKNAEEIKRIARQIPLDKMLLETDAPFLTPEPFRGKRNEPGFTRYTANKVAELRSLDVKIVEDTTTKNAYDLFRLERFDK